MSIARRFAAVVVVCFSFFSSANAADLPVCTVPGVNLLTDGTGDQVGAPVVPGDYDLASVSISEALTPPVGQPTLFIPDGKRRLIFTYKVRSLENLPPMTRWLFFFNGPSRLTTDAATVRETFFVGLTNFPDEGTKFIYGFEPTLNGVTGFESLGFAEAGSNYNVDGTITIVVPLNKFSFAPGATLDTFKANVVQSVGAATAGYIAGPVVDTGTGAGSYNVVATNACGTEGDGDDETVTVRAADERDPSFTIYPSADTLSADLFGAGEPTLDVNYATGNVFMRFIIGVTRTVFDDTVSPPTAIWEDVTDPIDELTSIPGLDPFLGGSYLPVVAGVGVGVNPLLVGTPDTTVDSRIFSLQLLGAMSAMVYSDDDGETWTPGQGGGQVHGADNQSIAAGPYPEDFLLGPVTLADYAVYYCSQGTINAFCSRSDNGGMTFNNSFPIFPVEGLCGNHGHVKVGPDGTVYVPMNNPCLGAEGVTLSIDGGITWTYITVPETAGGRWDSSIAIARDGKTVYYAYAEEGTDTPMVIKGTLIKVPTLTIQWDERGATNVGITAAGTPAEFKLNNIVFSTMVAGDPDRAAVIFHGTTTAGDSGAPAVMAGAVWHLYAATTLDGGDTWALRNITGADPSQKGAICDDGVACMGNTRNLLDFMDAVIDGQGRIVVAFADGCTGNCVPGGGAANNDAFGTLARQSGGPRMYAAFDPVVTNTAPTSSLTPATQNVTAGGTASFTIALSDTENDALSYSLNFGDGSPVATGTSSGTVTHIYTNATSSPVTRTVTLNVTEVGTTPALTATAKTATVTVAGTATGAPFSANLAAAYSKMPSASGPNQGKYDVSGSPLTVNFTASTANGDGSAVRYTMNFGDGIVSAAQSSPAFSHTYGNAGTYNAYVIATQKNGQDGDQSDNVTFTTFTTVTVNPGPVAAKAVLDPNFTSNVAEATVNFNTSGSTGTSYVLDFGDGTETPSQISGSGVPDTTVSHTYVAPGTYTARLTMTGTGTPASDVATATITIVAEQGLTAQLSVNPTIVVAGNTATPVTMDASDTVPANGKTREDYTYTFDFGDGSEDAVVGPGSEMTAEHVYTTAGTYTLTLTVTEDVLVAAAKSAPAAKAGATGPTTSVVRSRVDVNPPVATPKKGGGALSLWLLLPMLLVAIRRKR